MNYSEALLEKIRARKARIAVIGLGYVGLPLAVEFAKKGFQVTGIDLDASKVEGINAGRSHVEDIPSETVAELSSKGTLRASAGYEPVREADAVVICVPTPLSKSRDPDMAFIVSATEAVARHFSPGKLIVLESTTYPGTTEEILLPAFSEGGRKEGEDFFLAHSPERIDPGNKRFQVANTPKVVGGMSPASTGAAAALYGVIVEKVIPVSSPGAAEMVKLLENTFRSVNIALVNEVALICDRLGLNVWEIIAAAATKPFGFMPFYPGPGLGGHCIPVDPHYLSWKMRTLNFNARFIELAYEINSHMPEYVVQKTALALNDMGRSVKGARILLLGVSYKKDIADMRESPALDVLERLHHLGADVRYSDPFVPALRLHGVSGEMRAVPLTEEEIKAADCAVVTTDHTAFDYGLVARHARRIVDARNAFGARMQQEPEMAAKIVRL